MLRRFFGNCCLLLLKFFWRWTTVSLGFSFEDGSLGIVDPHDVLGSRIPNVKHLGSSVDRESILCY